MRLRIGTCILLGLIACGGDSGPDDSHGLLLTVRPDESVVNVGATLALTLEAQDSNGTVLHPASVVWSALEPSVATVSSTGVVTGRLSGTTSITARVGDVTSDPVTIAVADTIGGPCFSVASAPQLSFSAYFTFGATVTAADGAELTAEDDGTLGPSTGQRERIDGDQVFWSGITSGVVTVDRSRTIGGLVEHEASVTGEVDTTSINPSTTSLAVDLVSCRFRLVTVPIIRTVYTNQSGQQLPDVGGIERVIYAGEVPAGWRSNGIARASALIEAHSLSWLSSYPDSTALIPLGLIHRAFSGTLPESSIGLAEAEFELVPGSGASSSSRRISQDARRQYPQ